MPGEIVEGMPTLINCSVEHTCATSPPFLNWNISGLPVTEYNKTLEKGKYLKTSELTYVPSRDHKGSGILCIAIFFNGQTSQTEAKLNIINTEKNSNRDFRAIIAVACVISLSLIAFFIWRFLLGNKASTSRASNSFLRKNYSKDTKDTGYTDLTERENATYCVVEPATRKKIPQGKIHRMENSNIYEDI
ncbi:unnamed protein product [Staurois parvus]|uniref:Ig-like domain-containing protein n=1 Tax=Staurois parvus TaxID=386267 RepID=A0ABN9DS46_9NEOB|nr:unnamed protein product [Staurois parvus]